MGESDDVIRFADILTTASAVADYRGEAEVSAAHVLIAVEMLQGKTALEDLGRPVSPLVPRPGKRGSETRLRQLVQRWWHDLGEDVNATLDSSQVSELQADLNGLAATADA